MGARKTFTGIEVRNEIIACFMEAHKEVLNNMKNYSSLGKKDLEDMKKLNIKLLVKSLIKENGGDFDNPTKKDLVYTIKNLAKVAKKFGRSGKTIKKNYDRILKMIEKID